MYISVIYRLMSPRLSWLYRGLWCDRSGVAFVYYTYLMQRWHFNQLVLKLQKIHHRLKCNHWLIYFIKIEGIMQIKGILEASNLIIVSICLPHEKHNAWENRSISIIIRWEAHQRAIKTEISPSRFICFVPSPTSLSHFTLKSAVELFTGPKNWKSKVILWRTVVIHCALPENGIRKMSFEFCFFPCTRFPRE